MMVLDAMGQELTAETVADVRPDLPCVYRLGSLDGEGGAFLPRIVKWVSRDAHLALIPEASRGEYTHFSVTYFTVDGEPRELFDFACRRWHEHCRDMRCGHPRMDELRCTVPNCLKDRTI